MRTYLQTVLSINTMMNVQMDFVAGVLFLNALDQAVADSHPVDGIKIHFSVEADRFVHPIQVEAVHTPDRPVFLCDFPNGFPHGQRLPCRLNSPRKW